MGVTLELSQLNTMPSVVLAVRYIQRQYAVAAEANGFVLEWSPSKIVWTCGNAMRHPTVRFARDGATVFGRVSSLSE